MQVCAMETLEFGELFQTIMWFLLPGTTNVINKKKIKQNTQVQVEI